MHGRPRKAAKPEDEEASLAKAQKLRCLQSQFLSNHHNRKWVRIDFSFSIFSRRFSRSKHVFCFIFLSVDSIGNWFSYTKEALDVSAKLLEINPESYTAWNYRKLAVQHNIAESNSDPDSLKSILDVELRVVIVLNSLTNFFFLFFFLFVSWENVVKGNKVGFFLVDEVDWTNIHWVYWILWM